MTPGTFAGIEHRHAVEHRGLAVLDGLLGGAPVDDRGVVALALRRCRLERLVRHLRVVGGPERPARARPLAGRSEVPVERRRQDLPAHRHLAALRIDLDAADHAVELGLVGGRVGVAALGQRHREPRRDEDVFAVLGHERRAVVAARVRDRPEDLLGLEIAQVDARDAVVGVVVDEQPAAVVLAVALRQPRMVDVAPREAAHHLLRFLVEAVAGRRIRREDGNGRSG